MAFAGPVKTNAQPWFIKPNAFQNGLLFLRRWWLALALARELYLGCQIEFVL
jgi:hypothetical protein